MTEIGLWQPLLGPPEYWQPVGRLKCDDRLNLDFRRQIAVGRVGHGRRRWHGQGLLRADLLQLPDLELVGHLDGVQRQLFQRLRRLQVLGVDLGEVEDLGQDHC